MHESRASRESRIEVFVSRLLGELERVEGELASILSDTERVLYFLAWLNTRLEDQGFGRIVVVGGFAVELYTGATYRTMDVDLIVEGNEALEATRLFLERICERGLRVYIPRLRVELSKAIDIVGSIYTAKKPPIKITVGEYHVYLEAVEELIIRYLVGWKYWESSEDRDKVFALLATWWTRIDREYVYRRAVEEKVDDKLREAIQALRLG